MAIEREYRVKLGYPNANLLKKHFKGTDIIDINWHKIELYNSRIKDIFQELNNIVHESIKYKNLSLFNSKIDNAYNILKDNNIILKLNNHGRSYEDVYYNWMRGYAVCEFFLKALSIVFDVPEDSIKTIGNDKLTDINNFSKSPTADLEIKLKNKLVRLEIHSGFTGKNDIKHHKIVEAKKVFSDGIDSYIIHFDFFNGNAAIVDLSTKLEDNINWIKREELESQKVFSIPFKAFKWILTDAPLNYKKIIY